jgi:hypothetical protein
MPAKTNLHDLNCIKKYVTYFYRQNNTEQVNAFFNDLGNHLSLYSPSLGLVVEYNDWYQGGIAVGQTIDFVPITPTELANYWNAIGFDAFDDSDYDAHWDEGLLADFDHETFYFDDDKDDADRAVTFLAAICLAPDWTHEPYMVI